MKINDLVYTYSLIEDEIYKGRVTDKSGKLFKIDYKDMIFDNCFQTYPDALEYRYKQIGNRTLKMKLQKQLRKVKYLGMEYKPKRIYKLK